MATMAHTVTLAAVLLVAMSGCATTAAPSTGSAALPVSGDPATRAWGDSRQLVVVVTADWDATTGTLRRFERSGAGWTPVGTPFDVTVGAKGAAWGEGLAGAFAAPATGGPVKREGDGRAPAGAFAIGPAFGYGEDSGTKLRYAAMTANDYCMDVPASPLYNQIVDRGRVGAAAVAGSTEPMRRDLHLDGDQRYREGFVIQHNPGDVPGAGSCIFAHLWKAPGEPTAGCTAMAPASMDGLLAWLDARRQPRFVLLPRAEYERLQGTWQLPSMRPTAAGAVR